MAEPTLDAEDIQGNILPGFRRRHQLLVGYSGGSEGVLRNAIAVLAPLLTAIPPVLRHRDGRKAALTVQGPEPEIPDLWANLALGAEALDRLGDTGVRALDNAFRLGMRPTRTGDPWKSTDSAGEPICWSPANWKVGKPSEPLDLLLILAFDDWEAAGGEAFLAALDATGVKEIYREEGVRLPGDSEHFGFADGISEVGVRGNIEIDGQLRPITTRYGVPSRDGVDYGRPGQPLAWPGQFLVGAAINANEVDPAPERYRNGTFLVFRRLSQDVAAFDEDTQAIADQLQLAHAPVRASIVGRWPSGAALMRHGTEPIQADGPLAINYFGFRTASPDLVLTEGNVVGATGDPAPVRGLTCPAFAHIRKVNPRDLPTDLGDATNTQGFQMLRRGIPFGPAYDRANPASQINDVPRGLLFLAYQRNPELQFEKLNTSWMNTDKGPGPGGFDLLVGQKVSRQTGEYESKTAIRFSAPEPTPGKSVVTPRNWVRPSGGAYLFAPSLKHVAAMAKGPPATEGSSGLAKGAAKYFSLEIDGLDGSAVERLVGSPPRHDGEIEIRLEDGQERLLSARWPETALRRAEAAALRGATISTLDLSGQHFPTESLTLGDATQLARYRSLVRLQVDGTTLDGATLSALVEGLPNLATVNLAGADIDNADVATICEKRNDLVELAIGAAAPRFGHRFTAPRLTGAVIDALKPATGLRRLSMRGVPLTDLQLLASDLWDRLVEADLSATRITDVGAARLAQSPNLTALALANTLIGKPSTGELLKRRWQRLDLSYTQVQQGDLMRARYPEALESLRLAGLELDDGFADHIARATALRTLDLSQTSVSSGVAAAVGTLPQINELNLTSTALTGGDAVGLLRAPIEKLDIDFLANREDREAIAASPTLRRISLQTDTDWNGLSEIRADVSLVAPPPIDGGGPPRALRELWLSGVLGRELANRLRVIDGLKLLSVAAFEPELDFSQGFLGLQDVRAPGSGLDDARVAELLALPAMSALYISDNPFGAAFGGTINSNIHTLELRNTEVDDGAVSKIALLPRLHCIDVPGTRVTPGGVATLAANAINLQSLAIDGSQVDRTSVAALANAHRLLELYLYGHDVTTATIAAISAVGLRELLLINTQVDDTAVPHLAAIVGLRTLTLGNELSREALDALRALRPYLVVRSARLAASATGRR